MIHRATDDLFYRQAFAEVCRHSDGSCEGEVIKEPFYPNYPMCRKHDAENQGSDWDEERFNHFQLNSSTKSALGDYRMSREIDHVMDDIWHLDRKPIRGGNVIVVGGEDTNADGEDPEDARAENDDNIVHGDDGSETDGAENKSARRRADRASDGADHAQKGLSEAPDETDPDHDKFRYMNPWLPENDNDPKRLTADRASDGADHAKNNLDKAPDETDPHHDDFRDMNPWLPENNMKFDDPNKESSRHADTADERAHGLRGDCPTCDGSGGLYGNDDCPVCDGSGDVNKKDNSSKSTWTPPNYQGKGSSRKRAVDAEDEPENTETTKSEDQDIEQQSDEDHKVGRQAGVGNDEMDDSTPRGKDWDPFASEHTFMGEEREDDEDESDPDDGFGGKKAPPFGSKDSRRAALRSLADDRADDHLDDDGVNYDSDGEGHSDAYWNSIADDGPDGPEGEDKHSDPFVQRMRDKEKNSRRKQADDDLKVGDRVKLDATDDVTGIPVEGGQVGFVEEINGNTVVVDVHGGNVYEVSLTEVRKVQPWETTSRRKALRQIASEEPTFSPPNGISGKWTCNSCGKDVGGVHALNDHVDAHMKTKPADSNNNKDSRHQSGVDNTSMGDYASLNDDNWSLFI